jgi:DNA-binding protein H-NS
MSLSYSHQWAYCSSPTQQMSMEHQWNDTDRVQSNNSEKEKCPSVTLSTTNPTWTGQGVNPGLHGERPEPNCFSYGMDWPDFQFLD